MSLAKYQLPSLKAGRMAALGNFYKINIKFLKMEMLLKLESHF